MADLHTEVWIRQILEGFYPDSSFLKYAHDLSKLVDNDKINLAEAGKIEVVPTKPYSTQTDLSLAYSPGVAEPCLILFSDDL